MWSKLRSFFLFIVSVLMVEGVWKAGREKDRGFLFAQTAPPRTELSQKRLKPYFHFDSFFDYKPLPADFDIPFQGVVGNIADALRNPKEAEIRKKKLQQTVSSLLQLDQTISRGQRDTLYFLLGFAYEQLGEENKALDAYIKSLALRDENPVGLFRLGLILEQQKRYQEAIQKFEEVRWRTKQNEHEVLYVLGRTALESEQPELAGKYLELANQKNPNYAPVRKLLIISRLETLKTLGQSPERTKVENDIINDLRVIVAQDPHDRDAVILLSKLLLQHSDPLLQTEQLKQAQQLAMGIAQESDYRDDVAVRLVIDCQVKLKDLVPAEEILKLGLSRKPTSALLLQAKQQLELERGVWEEKNEGNS